MSTVRKSGILMMLVGLWLCIFGLQSEAQTFTTLHSFDGTDGANSAAGLIQATDGNFYGTTIEGGANSDGTVFRISPSGTLTTLYNFCSKSACSDGANPAGGLIQATDGNLYGTTELGTVFRITLSGTLTTLATLSSASGQFPLAGLIQGKDGNFYGTASRGGANTRCTPRPGYHVSCGTIFKITPSGTLTVLHSFDGTDGEKFFGALVQGTDGNFYGTSSFGGGNPNYGGTVFKITPNGTLTTLHSFGGTDGSGASAALIQATDGNFYGTTSGVGSNNLGTVFKISPSGTLTTLHSFNGTDGELSYAALVQGRNGEFYGTTKFGASSACSEGCGTILSLSVSLAP